MPRRNDHRPVTDEERAAMHTDMLNGMSRNAIARKYERAAATVSDVADQHHFTFDRTQTALAVAARAVDIADMQQQLARKFMVRADEALDAIDAPLVQTHYDGGWQQKTVLPGPGDIRNLMTVAAIGSQRAREILASGGADDQVAARSLLSGLRDGIDQIISGAPLPADEDPTRMPD